eukprot:SAG22_NODE_275_length_13171_cov_11.640606_12_plen_72_part_00
MVAYSCRTLACHQLTIYREDACLILLEKPADMPVHPAGGLRGGTLVNALLHHVVRHHLPCCCAGTARTLRE